MMNMQQGVGGCDSPARVIEAVNLNTLRGRLLTVERHLLTALAGLRPVMDTLTGDTAEENYDFLGKGKDDSSAQKRSVAEIVSNIERLSIRAGELVQEASKFVG